MSAIRKLVDEAKEAGIIFFIDDTGTPKMKADKKPPDSLVSRIQTNRNDLLLFLNSDYDDTLTASNFVNLDTVSFHERAGFALDNPDIPKQWVDGFAVLVSMPLPRDWHQEKWDAVLSSAERFLTQWGKMAHELGWSDNDIFGISESGSMARIDRLGLVLLLGDKRVSAMTSETAALECLNHRTGQPNGNTLTFYRKHNMPGSVPLWELVNNG